MNRGNKFYEQAKKYLEGNALEKGIAHLKKAAKLRNAKAQYNLGIFLHQGFGIKQSYDAFHYFKLAAQQAHPHALYMLGCYYSMGIVVDPSDETAAHHFQVAADLGSTDAQYNLGVLLLKGKGVAKSEIRAFQYFKKAADQNHADVTYNLGICFYQGLGILPSTETAIHYLELAVQRGQPKAPGALEIILMNA